MTTRKLLAQLVDVWNRDGIDSPNVREFIETHQDNEEFVKLAKLAIQLKKILSESPNK